MQNAAPSAIELADAAVIVPSVLKTGFNDLIFLISGFNGGSSLSISPIFIISFFVALLFIAFLAFKNELYAYSSCSFLLIFMILINQLDAYLKLVRFHG